MAKKQGRIDVALLCKECNKANYVKSMHKDNKPTKLIKFCSQCRCRHDHKINEKTK